MNPPTRLVPLVETDNRSGVGKLYLRNTDSGSGTAHPSRTRERPHPPRNRLRGSRKNNISLVFQNYNLIDYLSPIENIRLVNKSADESILFELGLDKKQIKRNVMKLSGGQQQRVAIARALVSDAPIILADEPTGNLDSVTAREIINILKTLAKDRDKCVIVVTHSKEVADSADIILELSGKKLKKVNKMNLEVE